VKGKGVPIVNQVQETWLVVILMETMRVTFVLMETALVVLINFFSHMFIQSVFCPARYFKEIF